MNFEKMVQKTVNKKDKTSLKSSIIVQNSDAYCPRGYRLFQNNSSKVQTQGSNNKNSPRFEEFKSKDPKSTLSHNDTAEPAKKESKKKKRSQRHRQERTGR